MKTLFMSVAGIALLAGGLHCGTTASLVLVTLGCPIGIGLGAILCSYAVVRLIEPEDLP